MPEMLQHAIVTLVAVLAAATLLRRVFGFVGLGEQRTGCAACPSARHACAPQGAPAGGTTTPQTTHHVAILVRPQTR